MGIVVAVVSQRPGNGGDIKFGRIEIDDGIGICRDRDSVGVKVTWAICEFDILL